MKVDDVTVLNVDGRLLASGSDSIDKSPDNLLALEKQVSEELREDIARTLTPYLSGHNFQVSVAARLNADKTQTNETIFNPDQRVERSVRVTKEQQNSQNAAGTQAAGVATNLPKTNAQAGEQKQSNDQTQKREELTNYEVSSKSIQTTSAGFRIQNLSIAVLINRAALTGSLGDKPSPEALAGQIKEIEQLVASAAGLDKQRGDIVKISVVDFVDASRDLEPAPGPSLAEIVARQSGSIVNAAAVVLVTAMVVWFGVRPGLKMLLAAPTTGTLTSLSATDEGAPELAAFEPNQALLIEGAADDHDEFLEALRARRDNGPERKLLKLIEFDESQAVAILKQWVREGASG
jgi:flagellar M-ring protein FliF